jgi:plasmid stabilization system protein ParE
MFKVDWTDEAEEDLENALTYYFGQAGFELADKIYHLIKAQVGNLYMMPHRCRPGKVEGTKEYVLHKLPYVAVVHISKDVVTVLNLIHTKRKYPPVKSK